jgi:hypothetical protein
MHTGERSVNHASRFAPDKLRQVGDSPQMGDTARVNDRGANEVDQLLGDQGLTVVDGIEYFADRDRVTVLANEPETFLVLRRRRILHPEQPVRLGDLPSRPASIGVSRWYVVENVMIKPKCADCAERGA